MERKWYIKDNGKTLLHGEPDDVARHHPSAEEIEGPPTQDHQWNGKEWAISNDRILDKRVKEYPRIGDQLDALLKHFSDEKSRGAELHPDLERIIDEWGEVKKDNPKLI